MNHRVTLLDRYLIRQMLPPFLVALAATLIALLLERLLMLLDHLASAGGSMATFLGLLADLLPHYIGLAFPAALCISVFLVIQSMSENNEIDALLAARVSLLRITRPFMQLGLVLGVLSVFLYGYIQPVARYDYREGFYFAAHAGWAPHLQSGMFATTSGSTVMTADKVTGDGTNLSHIFIRERGANGTPHIITAQTGRLTISSKAQTTRIDLWNGEIIDAPFPAPADYHSPVTHFEHTVRFIDRPSHQAAFRSRGADERELTMFELFHALRAGYPGITYHSLRAELDFRLARAIMVPFIPLLAAAFAMGVKRRRSVYGLIAMAAVLVGFDQIQLFGHGLADVGAAPVWLSIWVPEVMFCTGCCAVLLRRSRGSWVRRKLVRPS